MTPKLKPLGTRLEQGCPECGGDLILRSGKHGVFYGCVGFPSCSGTHGANRSTGEPLGTPVTREVKAHRVAAHKAFDRLWQGAKRKGLSNLVARQKARTAAYLWMAESMDLTPEDAHIGKFTIAQCDRLIELVNARLAETPTPTTPGFRKSDDS